MSISISPFLVPLSEGTPYGLAALLFVSTGLISLRYFYGHDLNLNAPITEVIFQDLAVKYREVKSAKAAKAPAKQLRLRRSPLSSL